MFDYFTDLDECVTDACAFLAISRPQFYDLARQWTLWHQTFHSFERPEDFYLGFQGDMGRANLCANILNQFSRLEIYALVQRFPGIKPDLRLADIGCGTAALSFPLLRRMGGPSFLIDVPNLAQDFVRWRCARHGFDHVSVGGLDHMDALVQVMICVDVLEHVAQSSAMFRRMDALLNPGGVLLFQAPWASRVPNIEHLPEAEADWHQGGGAEILANGYDLLHELPCGGLYHKHLVPPPA
jgi:2-polyprenyl-3-methyl-5-hydroxy-6-metoxy-1,4-benzoquinol methylase